MLSRHKSHKDKIKSHALTEKMITLLLIKLCSKGGLVYEWTLTLEIDNINYLTKGDWYITILHYLKWFQTKMFSLVRVMSLSLFLFCL